ncbi:MAG: prepilin-type N-terminal cleavage/methylation domain-containing protein [Akkermansiaceae bacterium]|jgi:prepilin-type N-terminal cleavage/methylation domain-containing protein|nr:prepilin-type N-terminal cleavage/methylation domain-containing protein [Akkermansiaceae bacterium]
MKNQSSRRNRGFTLVELLVVIAIIAVLASAGFAAGNAAIQKARKTTALSAATAIESAVNNFYTEYGSMPSDGTADDTVNTRTDLKLLRVLLGMDEGSTTPMNARAVKFLSVREGKSNKGGLIYSTNGTNISGMFDPWGGPYQVMMDLDYDEKLTVKPKGAGSQARVLNGRRVAAWSDGADGVTAAGKTADDVITW